MFARDVTKDNAIINVIETKKGMMFARHSRNMSQGVGKCLQCSSALQVAFSENSLLLKVYIHR